MMLNLSDVTRIARKGPATGRLRRSQNSIPSSQSMQAQCS